MARRTAFGAMTLAAALGVFLLAAPGTTAQGTPTRTPTPSGPGPYPLPSPAAGNVVASSRTIDRAPNRDRRDKATLIVENRDGSRETFLVAPEDVAAFHRDLPQGSRVIIAAPPESSRRPPPRATPGPNIVSTYVAGPGPGIVAPPPSHSP
jgi:hypothetical protein